MDEDEWTDRNFGNSLLMEEEEEENKNTSEDSISDLDSDENDSDDEERWDFWAASVNGFFGWAFLEEGAIVRFVSMCNSVVGLNLSLSQFVISVVCQINSMANHDTECVMDLD